MAIFPTNGEFYNPESHSFLELSPRIKQLAKKSGWVALAGAGATVGMIGVNQMSDHGNLLIGLPELMVGTAAFIGGLEMAFPRPEDTAADTGPE